MVRESVLLEDMTVLSMHAHDNRSSKYIRKNCKEKYMNPL